MTTPYAPSSATPPARAAQGPGSGHAPPLPERRAHLGHAIASEWTKIRSVRSTVWTLAVLFALVVGVGLLVAVGMSGSAYLDMPVLSGGFFGLMLGQLAVITLGVLVVTSEYSTGMIRSTMTVCPQRGRVLSAKAIVFFLLSFVMTLAACGITAVIQSAVLEGKPLSPYADTASTGEASRAAGEAVVTSGEWLDATVGAALYVALLGLLSLAVGTLLRSTPGAVTTMLGLVLVPFIVSLFLTTENTFELGETIREYSTLNGLATLFHIPIELSSADPGTPNGWPLLGVLAAVTAAALAAAYARIALRDV
ncbi:ABC transporter permease [Streptomyces sp. TRM 70351]|uniref:ABC transporter permease n=1 Tax=Streptomyces sp. TRM 70351 TaxID=3116552 RepID=UPI002E7BBB5C|nr:ABC transporter permease [Streptomyces sp. TRM 70351]MEE1927478.1 ABC transporter permease [Streptomyces sp. TRM 70351]